MGARRTFRNRIRNVTNELIEDGGKVARATAKGLTFVAGRLNVLACRLDGTDARVSKTEKRLDTAEEKVDQLQRFNITASNARDESRRAVQSVDELARRMDLDILRLREELGAKADANEQNIAWSNIDRRITRLEVEQDKPKEMKPEPESICREQDTAKPSTQDTKPQEQDAVPETVHREPDTAEPSTQDTKPQEQDAAPVTLDAQPDIELDEPAQAVYPGADAVPVAVQEAEEPEVVAPQEDQTELMARVEELGDKVVQLYGGADEVKSALEDAEDLAGKVEKLKDMVAGQYGLDEFPVDSNASLSEQVQELENAVKELEGDQ